MFECSNERFGIKRLVSAGGSDCRTTVGDSAVGERLDEFFDDEIATRKVLEGETGAFGIDGAGRGVGLGVYGRIVRHFGC